jgi:preprotein translocase subunit SecD
MNNNLRWKLLTVFAAFVIFFVVGVYPILAARYHWPAPSWLTQRQLKLGLDLKGGVHLVLRVQTDDALKIMTTTTSEQLRESLKTANVPVSAISVSAPTTFRVEGVPGDRDAEFRKIAGDLASANYDYTAGAGGAYDFKMKPNIERDTREQAVVQAM